MRERKAFRLELRELDDNGQFEGYASVFGNVDSWGDVIDKGAFEKTIADKKGKFPILWQHDIWAPIGVSLEMEEDLHGLAVKGELNLETQQGRECYALLKQKALEGLSIGFQTLKWASEEGIRHLKEIKLWEFSVVTFPANELAIVTGVKSDVLNQILRGAELVRREGKVLSAANRKLVEQAIEALGALLEAAEPAKSRTSRELAPIGARASAAAIAEYMKPERT